MIPRSRIEQAILLVPEFENVVHKLEQQVVSRGKRVESNVPNG
jgi:hypothetical protein